MTQLKNFVRITFIIVILNVWNYIKIREKRYYFNFVD